MHVPVRGILRRHGHSSHSRRVQRRRVGGEHHGERPWDDIHGAVLHHVLLLEQPYATGGDIALCQRVHRHRVWVFDGDKSENGG